MCQFLWPFVDRLFIFIEAFRSRVYIAVYSNLSIRSNFESFLFFSCTFIIHGIFGFSGFSKSFDNFTKFERNNNQVCCFSSLIPHLRCFRYRSTSLPLCLSPVLRLSPLPMTIVLFSPSLENCLSLFETVICQYHSK